MTYTEKLNLTKQSFPFENWKKYEMEQYSEENCNKVQKVFDDLIENLIQLGENADEKSIMSFFEKAVNKLNVIDYQNPGLIETGERESLCELINEITIATDLNPANYGGGEGLASIWREW